MGIYGHKFDNLIEVGNREYVCEINLKDTVENIKKTIKKAILSLINKIETFIDNKCKESPFKETCKRILGKLRILLTKSDHMDRMEEFEKAKEEINSYGDEFKNIESNFYESLKETIRLSHDIKDGKTTLSEVKERIKKIKQEYGKDAFNSYRLDKNDYPEPWTMQTINDLNILSASGASSVEYFLFFATVADEVYGH